MVLVRAVEVWRCQFPLRLAFSHNQATRRRVETLVVCLRGGGGHEGYGQALPRAYLTGESLDSVDKDIRRRWWPAIRTLDLPDGGTIDEALTALRSLHAAADDDRALSAYAAVEMALADLYGKEQAQGMALPASEAALPLVGVISGGGPRVASWTAWALFRLGYRRFKVKVGPDAGRDDARLTAVRRVVGSDCQVSADANGAWGWDEAVKRMRGLVAAGVHVVEEPLCAAEAATADFHQLEKEGGAATMADESLCTLADAEDLLRRGSPTWWNLRLGKNGGFNGMASLSALAREHGVRLYGGVLVGETSALAAAGRAAMWRSGVECGEYGFPRVLLRGDPFRGGPGGYTGTVRPPAGGSAGFGVRLDREKLVRVGKVSWQEET